MAIFLSLEINFQLHLMTRESGSHIILLFLDSFLLSIRASELIVTLKAQNSMYVEMFSNRTDG